MRRSGSAVTLAVHDARSAAGMSQIELATAAGITRQAVSSIEAGYYIPNTTVALRLARALGCRVEDLFKLDEAAISRSARMAGAGGPQLNCRVAVGRVRENLIAHPLNEPRAFAEGFASAGGIFEPSAGKTKDQAGKVTYLFPEDRVEASALLLGCDPSLGLLSEHVGRRFPRLGLEWVQSPSAGALDAVARGDAHIGGSHIYDSEAGSYNVGPAGRALARTGGRLVCLAAWEQGFVVASGNPKRILGGSDLGRTDVAIINRPVGSGARDLLDRLLAEAGVPASLVRGYERSTSTHVSVARAVAAGAADVGVTLRAVAETYGLGFVPIAEVQFDLAVPEDLLDHIAVDATLEALNEGSFRAELRSLPGYETARTGATVAVFGKQDARRA